MILAIDPGNEQSAYVLYDGTRPIYFGKADNEAVVARLAKQSGDMLATADELAIEMVASYGMAVGREVFETCVWTGRFVQAFLDSCVRRVRYVYRREVKLHLCGQSRAKDANIRQALIDRYGGREKAIGKKASPGPLYGVSADVWSALAVAVTWSDQNAATGSLAIPGGC